MSGHVASNINTTIQGNRTDGNSIAFFGPIHGGVQLPPGAQLPSTVPSTSRQDECLRDLRITDPREDKTRIEDKKDKILRKCYAWILEDTGFQQWRDDPNARLLWIKGDPGKGKTMMMIGLINELSASLLEEVKPKGIGQLWRNFFQQKSGADVMAYFFCETTRPEQNSAVSVLRGLIYLLANHRDKSLLWHVQKRYDLDGKQLFEGPNAIVALRQLLLEIIKDPSLRQVYLLVDALDECSVGLHELMRIITDDDQSKVKWIVTSRNVPDIERFLKPDPDKVRISLELNSNLVSKAVAYFIGFKASELAKARGLELTARNEIEKLLSKKAEGTFLWVSLVCKELEKVALWKVQSVLEKFPTGLNLFYDRMMEDISNQDAETAKFCLKILQSVTLAYRPLQIQELLTISGLLGSNFSNERVLSDLIERCGSFLTVRKETVFFVHLTAKDYFVSGKGRDRIFPNGDIAKHGRILHNCLDIMLHNTLKRDMCGLQKPGAKLQEALTKIHESCVSRVSYACVYWVAHLRQYIEGLDKGAKDMSLIRDNGRVHEFLKKHLLHWIEAMSLVGKVPEAVSMMQELQSMLTSGDSLAPASLVQDARRFIMNCRVGIETAPLQVYYSALLFAPQKSIVKHQFKDQIPDWIRIKPDIPQEWGSLLQTLEGHTESVHAVVFSGNGQLIASTSTDKTIRLWDAGTGRMVQKLEGHTERVSAAAFSPNGQVIASASYDGTIRQWDITTGRMMQILEGHTEVDDVTFSPDGEFLASASSDKTARIWNATSGAQLEILKEHTAAVTRVAFSPNSQFLASASNDNTARLWDTAGIDLYKFDHHDSPVYALAFSPESDRLASASKDRTIKVWNLGTGEVIHRLKSYTNMVIALKFLQEGDVLAAGSDDKTIHIWDPSTFQALKTLDSHTSTISAISFSPQNDLLVSASEDGKIRLWDTTMIRSLHILKGHTAMIYDIAFSPHRNMLASACANGVIRLWDSATGRVLQTFDGHTTLISALCFTPSSDALVSASYDQTVRIWDTATGQQRQVLKHERQITAVAFFLETNTIASASNNGMIFLWDITKAQARKIHGSERQIRAVAFSPNGNLLASGSDDKTVKLWDVATGNILHTLQGHNSSVTILSFSPFDDLLASVSTDKKIILWDSAGRKKRELKGHKLLIRAITFSPQNNILASASHDKTVRLWDTKKGDMKVLEGHHKGVNTIAFNPQGDLLVSGSDDTTVQLWDTTGQPLKTLYGHASAVIAVAFSTQGTVLASASWDNTIRLWNASMTRNMQMLERYKNSIQTEVSLLLPKFNALAVRDNDMARQRATSPTIPEQSSSSVTAVSFSPLRDLCASGAADGSITLWDSQTGIVKRHLTGHNGRITGIVFSPRGRYFASTSADRSVRVWVVDTGLSLLPSESLITGLCVALTFSYEEDVLLTAAEWGLITLWNLQKNTVIRELRSEERGFTTLIPARAAPEKRPRHESWQYELDEKCLLSVALPRHDNRSVPNPWVDLLKSWDVTFNTTNHSLENYFVLVESTPEDEWHDYSGLRTQRPLRLWDVVTGWIRQIPEARMQAANAVAFDSTGKKIAVGSKDGSIHIWHLEKGIQLRMQSGNDKPIMALVFSKDDRQLAVASQDGTVRLWDTTNGAMLAKLKVDVMLQRLSFSDTGILETDRGLLPISSKNISATSTEVSKQLFVSNHWLVVGMEDVLWLPHDYRANGVDVQKNQLMLGHASGRVSFIEINSD